MISFWGNTACWSIFIPSAPLQREKGRTGSPLKSWLLAGGGYFRWIKVWNKQSLKAQTDTWEHRLTTVALCSCGWWRWSGTNPFDFVHCLLSIFCMVENGLGCSWSMRQCFWDSYWCSWRGEQLSPGRKPWRDGPKLKVFISTTPSRWAKARQTGKLLYRRLRDPKSTFTQSSLK